ncbi:Pr6Pr family membrane protein [Brachybacterium sp. FME24]|uniref:Pr6Pr family membrane protein n=1 Tax=Brachybacterium sp. FME24 TaxID=2742605 RepID=UPI001868DA59|nr:Pr6Pr family membrane protein [Brachybacterium sp. FME24]
MTTWWPYLRLAAAGLALAAIVRQLSLAVANAREADTAWGACVPTVVANFFSYFTILSNLLAACVLLVGAIWLMRHRHGTVVEPAWLATLFACATTYIVVTGVVYNLLLRSISIAGISDAWTNETLHVVIPLVLLGDAFLAPKRRALPWRAIAVVVVFPIIWVLYTMVRANLVVGPLTGDPWWYPYPFLDPHLVPGGTLGVAGYIVGIAVAITAVAAGVVWLGRYRARPATSSPRSSSRHPGGGENW